MWRFIQLTDTHLASEQNGIWNNRFLCSMMPDIMACLKRDLKTLNPDFLLVTGDIVSHNTREAVFHARNMLDTLGRPYYPAGGNHDFFSPESRGWFLEAYAHRLPTSNTVYSFTHKNLRFCVLDPWWLWRDGSMMPFKEIQDEGQEDEQEAPPRWALPPEQFVWLESVLSAFPKEPVCVVTHYPVFSLEERFSQPDYKFAGALENGDMLVSLLKRHHQVKIVFSGHAHTNAIMEYGEVMYVCTAALPEYPSEFRVVSVYDDHISIKTQGLSNQDFAKQSLIPGHEYTAGTAEDRSATIYFDKKV
ncbi:MAG: metallophosphoesterase family protein [Candidatus Hydrogenedentales bacterium]|jgi:3',5'-cyclic AMP phosphodiesterase CpdA